MRKRAFDAFAGIVACCFGIAIASGGAISHCQSLGFFEVRMADKVALGLIAGLGVTALVFMARALLPTRFRNAIVNLFV